MTSYAITQVHFENGRIVRVMLHVVDNFGPGEFGSGEREDTDASQVANLLVSGDCVCVAKAIGPGEYAKADEVRLKQGTDDLISAWIADRPARLALRDSPQY